MSRSYLREFIPAITAYAVVLAVVLAMVDEDTPGAEIWILLSLLPLVGVAIAVYRSVQRADEDTRLVQLENRLKELRAVHGWSQAHLADLVDVSRQTVDALEKGATIRASRWPSVSPECSRPRLKTCSTQARTIWAPQPNTPPRSTEHPGPDNDGSARRPTTLG